MSSAKKSIGISFATQYLELTIHFLAVLALARILSPEDTGTYSVAAFLMTLLHVFRDFGVVQYIIQEQDLTADKIRSAMGVAIILALTVASILFASSSLLAGFYGNPKIEKILVVMAASFAISPFGSLLIGIFRREMALTKIFYIKLVSSLSHVAVALILAMRGFGALSLAWANFAGILSFGIAATLMRPKDMPWLPHFSNVKTILSFGSVASLGNAANIAGTNIPDLIIGKIMNLSAVGYFSRANGLVQLFTKLITGALLPLVLPYFSQIRRQGGDLAQPYLAAVEYLTALAWPFFAVMMLLAYPMVRTLYGPQWDASVPVVELLCVAGAIASISLFAGQVMVANGQVRSSTQSQLLAQPFRVAGVFLAASYGLVTVAIALIVSEAISLAIISWYLHKTIRVSARALIKACSKSAVVAACSAAVPLWIHFFWKFDPSRPWLPLVLGIFGAACGWLAAMLATRHPLASHLLSLVKPADETGNPSNPVEILKRTVKNLAYRCGLLGLYHRMRNRGSLTVVMFHRVLPASDPRYPGADPEWTMTPETFAACLEFFRKHYRIVSPDEVFAALRNEVKLPKHCLLVTFDDGWADTAQFAQPILDRFAIPALVFVAGGAIGQTQSFWEERVYSHLATHPDALRHLETAVQSCTSQIDLTLPSTLNEGSIRKLIAQLGKMDSSVRDAIIQALPMAQHLPPAMMSAAELANLANGIHVIGGHGLTHRPLTRVAGLEQEIGQSRSTLSAYLAGKMVDSMSFPHGAYSDQVVAECKAAGYRYLFSSNPCLIPVETMGSLDSPVGRIHISERAICNRAGKFQPAQMATWLFLRPLLALGGKAKAEHA